MHHLAALLQRLIAIVEPIAERLGGPGLTLIAFFDSSFLSLPEASDALVIILTVKTPSEWLYFAAMTTLGSVAGCFALYSVGRKGGEAFLRRKFRANHIEGGLRLFRRFGLLAIIVPSLLPPPMPFKLFVLLAGIADIKPRTFLIAVTLGRGFRYGATAWLAYMYGEQASVYIRNNLPAISMWLAGGVLVVGIAVLVWRRRQGNTAQ
ncbi:MAG: VTT domain-containing protein [Vicinamibacterales bacterium]